MKLSLKSLLRRPLTTLLLFGLIAAVSFGFVARAAEYLAITREVNRLSEYYRSIGYLTAQDREDEVTAGAALLSDSPLIAGHDLRRTAAAHMPDLYNADLNGNLGAGGYRTNETLFWGWLESASLGYFTFRVEEHLSGYPEYAEEGRTYIIRGRDSLATLLEPSETYLVRAAYFPNSGSYINLTLLQAEPGGAWFLPADTPEEKIAALLAGDVVAEHNRHSVPVYATKDMSAMPEMQEKARIYNLTDGRWLNAEDQSAARQVCVVHDSFAKARGLAVGDTIDLALFDRQTPFGYAPSDAAAAYIETAPAAKPYTVVGLYNSAYDGPSYNTLPIYLPDSSLPAAYDAAASAAVPSGRYSFVLRSPADKEELAARYKAPLAALGLTLHFSEDGFEDFTASTAPILRSTAASALIFTAVQLFVLVFAAFLYLRQHRREFAICRAMGVSARTTSRQQLAALLPPGLAAIALGGSLAWQYALGQAQGTLSALVIEGQTVQQPSLSLWYLAALCTASLGVLALFTALGLFVVARRSPLDILQGGQTRPARRSPAAPKPRRSGSGGTKRTTVPLATTKLPHLPQFMARKLRRGMGKSMLAVGVSAIFVLALGWMGWSILQTGQKIEDMYANTPVTGTLLQSTSITSGRAGIIPERVVQEVLRTGLVTEGRLVAAYSPNRPTIIANEQASHESNIVIPVNTICAVGDERHLNAPRGETSDSGVITYADGWDSTLFGRPHKREETPPVLLPSASMETLELSPGDIIRISYHSAGFGIRTMDLTIAGSYTGSFGNLGAQVDDHPLLLPLDAMRKFMASALYYSVAEFSVNIAQNRTLATLRTQVQEVLDREKFGPVRLTFTVKDEELRQVVEPLEKNLTLMKVLYPIAQTVAVLVAGTVALLLLLQDAKTAAMLRMLGVTGKDTRKSLGLGMLALCLLGVVLGVLVTLLSGKWSPALLLCAALYLTGALTGTLLGCRNVTNKKPLELLQIKE